MDGAQERGPSKIFSCNHVTNIFLGSQVKKTSFQLPKTGPIEGPKESRSKQIFTMSLLYTNLWLTCANILFFESFGFF